jgi:hypothetical protein
MLLYAATIAAALAGIAAAPHATALLPGHTPLCRLLPRGEMHEPARCSPAVELHDQLAAAVVVHKLKLANVSYRRQNALITMSPAWTCV